MRGICVQTGQCCDVQLDGVVRPEWRGVVRRDVRRCGSKRNVWMFLCLELGSRKVGEAQDLYRRKLLLARQGPHATLQAEWMPKFMGYLDAPLRAAETCEDSNIEIE